MELTISRYQLEEVADRLDLEMGSDVRPDYSGRGMYGKTCVGVVTDSMGGFVRFLLEVASEIGLGSNDEIGDLADRTSRDSMGLSTIYYWRGLTVEEDDDDDDDGSE